MYILYSGSIYIKTIPNKQKLFYFMHTKVADHSCAYHILAQFMTKPFLLNKKYLIISLVISQQT